jgi:hypothetical protein
MPLHTDALRLHASSPGNFYMGEAGHAIQGRVQTILKLGFHPFSRVRWHTNHVIFCGEYFKTQYFYTGSERPLERDGFTQRDDFTEGILLHAGALTQRCCQHKHACTGRCFRTQILLHGRWLCKEKLADAGAFTHRCLCAEMLLHTSLFTCQYVYAVLLHTFFYAEIHLHASTFTRTYFDTHTATGTFTHKYV